MQRTKREQNRTEGPASFHCFNRTHLQFSFCANVSGRDINARTRDGAGAGSVVKGNFTLSLLEIVLYIN